MKLDKAEKGRNNKYKILLAAIAIILFLILAINFVKLSDNPLTLKEVQAKNISVKNVTEIKVLIFNGDGVMEESVEGIEDALNDSNDHNLTPYYHYNYSTSYVINSKNLSSYDVLIMPGGNATAYLYSNDIDSGAIKQFVSDGKGYIGICAGAYVASSRVDGYYTGWGIASDVNTKNQEY
ncbi:MAG: BPL-N domain-containing protein, partial [Methanobacteriaceae archaeon]